MIEKSDAETIFVNPCWSCPDDNRGIHNVLFCKTWIFSRSFRDGISKCTFEHRL